MEKQTARFRFLGYNIIKSSLDVNTNSKVIPSRALNTNFSIDGSTDEGKNIYLLTVTTKVSDETGTVNIEVTMLGRFEYDGDLTDEQKETFFVGSGPAILFPYIRAYISSLTTLGGLPPVILPTLNFAQMAINKRNEEAKR